MLNYTPVKLKSSIMKSFVFQCLTVNLLAVILAELVNGCRIWILKCGTIVFPAGVLRFCASRRC